MMKGKKRVGIYTLVFGAIAVVFVGAALSVAFFNHSLSSGNVSLSNLRNYGPAPNIQGISGWINSQPLNISQLRGKVVLVDFWTYSCINCIREIPHLNAWYSEYGKDGLVIIGVSTPEFQFEHNYSNVLDAVRRFGIEYPVALDNNYSTWDAYGNEYWPAEYLIDANGSIRYVVLGEGGYNTTEQVIRELLVSAGYSVPSYSTNVPLGVNFSEIGSPEMYLGYQEIASGRVNYIGNANGLHPNEAFDYSLPNASQLNTIYLGGEWYSAPDSIIAENRSVMFLRYSAKDVNIVASGNGANTSIVVKLDGANLTQGYLGSDDRISNGTAVVSIGPSRLYNIVSAQSYGTHTLEIEAGRGFRIYTFTFG
jgi:thiol-disulfide isomerase/thioredoxin